MTWKSTAVAGLATITATWLASYAPVGRAVRTAPATPTVEHTENAAAAIQREADRLHDRLTQVGAYRNPARNPFKFGSHAPARTIAPRPEPAPVIDAAPVSLEPTPTLNLSLTGIAEDAVGDAAVRTAIISTPSDVLLVKVGDQVGPYRVQKISADGVELIDPATGASVKLMLRP